MSRFADALTLSTYPGGSPSEWTVAFRTDTGVEGAIPVILQRPPATPQSATALAELMGLRALLVEHGLGGFERYGHGLSITVSQRGIVPWATGISDGDPSLRPYATFLRTRLLGAAWCEGTPEQRVLNVATSLPALSVNGPLPILESTSVGPVEITHHAASKYLARTNHGDHDHAYRLLRRQLTRHPLLPVERPAVVDALSEVRHGEIAECFLLRDGIHLVCIPSRDGSYRIAVTCYVRV